jgi:hypothetical protein
MMALHANGVRIEFLCQVAIFGDAALSGAELCQVSRFRQSEISAMPQLAII